MDCIRVDKGRWLLVAALAFAGNAGAQERDLDITIGLKLWATTWESSLSAHPLNGSYIISLTSGATVAPIPSLTVRWRNFFLSAGHFVKTSYDFPSYTDVVYDESTGTVFTEVKDIKAERSELDLNVGWYVLPQLAVTVGYKEVRQEFNIRQFVPLVGITQEETEEYKYKTPTIGILGSAPVGSGFNIYGNAAYGPTKLTTPQASGSAKGWYGSGEFGLAYPIGRSGVVSGGFKHQVLDVESTGEQRIRDVSSGFVLGGSFTF